MKKFLYAVAVGLGSLLATSCNMDLEPVGSITDDQALLNATDCFRFRNGFYNRVRSLSTGGYISYTEIQMDNFIGDRANGNRLGDLNNGTIISSNSDIESIWGGLYSGIADCNFFLERAPKILAEPQTEENAEAIKLYIAESYFMRGYFYFWLLDHYCPAYTDATKNERLGLPLVTVYNPTSSKDVYPGRSTLEETYNFIKEDLQKALEGLEAYENTPNVEGSEIDHKAALVPMSPYVCSYTVKALLARIALLQRDYETAISLAEEVINSRIYTLTAARSYLSMWTNDNSNELIFRPISSATEAGVSSTGGAWIGASKFQADYLVMPYVALQSADDRQGLYQPGDVRYNAFVESRNLQVEGGIYKAPCFKKYPGNPSLNSTSTNALLNMAKPFRLSEQYLIVAEAAAELGQESKANDMLKYLRERRFTRDFTYTATSGNELIRQVRLERLRELIGEGFRMSDLRRWNQGFSRTGINYTNYPQANEILVIAGTQVVYQDNDYRYTWPIPAAEIQVNPKLQGQQNPGY